MGRSRQRRYNEWIQYDQCGGNIRTAWNMNKRQYSQNVIIPYEIDTEWDFKYYRIKRAIRTIEKYSRLRFDECFFHGDDHSCLLITEENGCFFKEIRSGPGYISLGAGCESFGTILHELLHFLGFPHEHTRPDRDKYITICRKNIQTGDRDQFYKLKPYEYKWPQFPFDFDSVMMYEGYAFSKNGLETIKAKDGGELRDNNYLSNLDKEKLRLL